MSQTTNTFYESMFVTPYFPLEQKMHRIIIIIIQTLFTQDKISLSTKRCCDTAKSILLNLVLSHVFADLSFLSLQTENLLLCLIIKSNLHAGDLLKVTNDKT